MEIPCWEGERFSPTFKSPILDTVMIKLPPKNVLWITFYNALHNDHNNNNAGELLPPPPNKQFVAFETLALYTCSFGWL